MDVPGWIARERDPTSLYRLINLMLWPQPNFDPTVLLSTIFGFVRSNGQRLSITGHQRWNKTVALQLFGDRLGALF